MLSCGLAKLSSSELSAVYVLLNFEERSVQHVAPAQDILHMQLHRSGEWY